MKKTYPNGCKKAFTISYDDGVGQDKRLVEIFNKYGLKCAFNLNYGLLDEEGHWETEGVIVKRLKSSEVKELFKGHEVANHGLTHPHIPTLPYDEKVEQLKGCKEGLEKLLGEKIEGMAYPFGGTDDETIEIMKSLGIKYGRVVPSTNNFNLPKDFHRLEPTAHHNAENIFQLIEEYKNYESDELSMFYLWGHSYEFDVDNNWEHIEKICQEISGRDDIWYCTNIELINYLEENKK